ncbi:MAG: helix-hairpin-helix domain-containing protein [Flavobacteriales bacterium]|nr:MAG: helix-hairpin-helix domain-containing protein [Flavobacteriales bacterium]
MAVRKLTLKSLATKLGLVRPKRQRKEGLVEMRPSGHGLLDAFDLHHLERRAMLMACAGLLMWASWLAYRQWSPEKRVALSEVERSAVVAFVAKDEPSAIALDTAGLTPFDPNALDRTGWMALGLTERQAGGILRWVERGGRFRSKADVAKMYSIKPEQFALLAPFMLLPDSAPERLRSAERRERKPWPVRDTSQRTKTWPDRPVYEVVELNAADSAALTALPGIGPSFARGIIKYRNQLGGYVSIEQLNEVFVLRDKPDAVQKIAGLLRVDAVLARKLNVNAATAEEFTGHPYLWKKWSIAKAIVAYRTQHGPYTTVEDIKKCLLVDDELFQKLSPYLTTGP